MVKSFAILGWQGKGWGLSRRLHHGTIDITLVTALNNASSDLLPSLQLGLLRQKPSSPKSMSEAFQSITISSTQGPGDAYISLAIVIARVTSCRACVGIARSRKVFRANIDEEQELRILSTCSVTISFSPIITPRILMVFALLVGKQGRKCCVARLPTHGSWRG